MDPHSCYNMAISAQLSCRAGAELVNGLLTLLYHPGWVVTFFAGIGHFLMLICLFLVQVEKFSRNVQ